MSEVIAGKVETAGLEVTSHPIVIQCLIEDSPAMFIGESPSDYEEAIIGYAVSGRKVVYSYWKLIDLFRSRDEMSEEEAMEHMSFNVEGTYLGEHMPIIVGGTYE